MRTDGISRAVRAESFAEQVREGGRAPSAVVCGLAVIAFKLALDLAGFDRTIRWIRRRVQGVPVDSAAPIDMVRRADLAVAMTGALYPGRALCMVQSLALYYVLRRRGVAVKYCQGVMPRPFTAHAWVEYRGEVVNDVPDHAEQFLRLPDQLP